MSAPHRFGLGRIAVRQLWSRRALAVAQWLALAAASTLAASVVLIQREATDNGLRSALAGAAGGANLVVERDGISDAATFDAFQQATGARVQAELGSAVIPGARFARSVAQTVRTIDGVNQGPPVTWNPSVVSYAGLRDHVHVVAGQWPADTRSGSDWLITMSARATDDLGTPIGVRVGQLYCLSPSLSRGLGSPWCGLVAATWLPDDVSDPYWAGHVPETDVATGHDSYFQIVAPFSGLANSAEQQYVPDPASISGGDAGHIVSAVNGLRGYYSVASNDVFVSGLDTTVSGFLTRESAAAGPTLVAAFGLLVVALAAMGFAALQFIGGHIAVAALWRARGWSRWRVSALYTLEFAILAVLAAPPAIVAAAGVSSAVAGSSAGRPGFGWQRLADATWPVLVAAAVFLVILAGLAAARGGAELVQRRRERSPAMRGGWRRRAADLVAAAAGVAILVFVRLGAVEAGGASAPTAIVVLALPVLAVGLLAFASLRLIGYAAAALTVTRSVGGRLARWQVERDPGQYSRLCLLVTLAVTVGVFASTYTASDRASALDRADYMVGADVRALFNSAASPPPLDDLTATLPSTVRTAQVFRGAGRPGRSGTDATILGVQGQDLWGVAYDREDLAARPLPSLTSLMNASDPDGLPVPATARSLVVSAYSSGLDARLEVEITDSTGRDGLVSFGSLAAPGWKDLSAPLAGSSAGLAPPVRLRTLRVIPTGSRAGGDVALQNLRTDSGAVLERFTTADGWWQEAFAPDTAESALVPTTLHAQAGQPSADVVVDLETVVLAPPFSSRPLPALLASQTMADLGLSIGQSFPVHIDTVDVQLVAVGSFDYFPTYYPAREPLIVVPRSSFLARLGHQGAPTPWPNELWTTSGGDAHAVVATLAADSDLRQSFLRSDAESAASTDPLRLGLADELGLGFIVALAVVVIGFALHFLAAAENRVTQFAIMRANGIPERTLRDAMVAEQAVVLLSALVAGTLIGLALAWAVVPLFHLGTLPEDLTPPSLLHLDPLTLVAVVLGTGALALLVGGFVARAGARVDVMAEVRSLA